MNICFVSPYSPQAAGGVGQFVIDMGHALTEKDKGFLVIARYEPPEFDLDKIFKHGINYFEVKPVDIDGLRTITSTIYTFFTMLKIRKRTDVVHIIQYFPMTVTSAFFGKILGKPVITTIFSKYPKSRNPISNILNKISWNLIPRISNEIAFECQMTKKALKSDKGVVVLNGIDTSYFSSNPRVRTNMRNKLGIGEDEVAILFLSRITRSKGIFELLEAMNKLKHALDRRLKLLLVGSIEDEDLFKRINELDIEDITINIGPVGRMEVYDYYCAGDIYVLPSYLEGISSSLIEAMSCGLPPIVTSVGGNLEVVTDGKNGLLVEPRNSEELAAKIQFLIVDDAKRMELSKNARLSIERDFSIDRMVNEYISLYHKHCISSDR